MDFGGFSSDSPGFWGTEFENPGKSRSGGPDPRKSGSRDPESWEIWVWRTGSVEIRIRRPRILGNLVPEAWKWGPEVRGNLGPQVQILGNLGPETRTPGKSGSGGRDPWKSGSGDPDFWKILFRRLGNVVRKSNILGNLGPEAWKSAGL